MSRWSRSSGPVRVLTGITAGLAVMGGTACFVAPAPPTSRQATAAEVRQRFPLLQEGRTSAREIRARFGEPASEHDAGRMLIYLLWFDDLQCLQLQRDKSGSMLAGRPDASPTAQLILVFTADGILERYRLLYRMPEEIIPKVAH